MCYFATHPICHAHSILFFQKDMTTRQVRDGRSGLRGGGRIENVFLRKDRGIYDFHVFIEGVDFPIIFGENGANAFNQRVSHTTKPIQQNKMANRS